MPTVKDIIKQIRMISEEVTGTGLSNEVRYPSERSYSGGIREIGVSEVDNSVFLKNFSYSELYHEMVKRKMYNLKMLDGGLIYMLYRFRGGKLFSHRLSYLPAPDLEAYQNEPDIYMTDEMFADILDRQIVTVPLRFDFDEDACVPMEHPKCHLTLGQYKNCRIPVTAPLTPYQFVTFIMRCFYYTAQRKNEESFTAFGECFEKSIFDEERTLLHICTPEYRP